MYGENRENVTENLKKYTSGEIEKVNEKIDTFFHKTNDEIEFLKQMMKRLETIIVGDKEADGDDSENVVMKSVEEDVAAVVSYKENVADTNDEVIQEYKTELNNKIIEINNLNRDLLNRNQKINALNELVDELTNEKIKQGQTIDALDQKVYNKTEEVENLNTLMEQVEQEKSQQYQTIDELNVRLKNKQLDIDKLNQLIDQMEAEKDEQNQKNGSLDLAIDSKNQKIADLNLLIDKLEEEKDELNQKIVELDEDLDSKNEKIEKFNTLLASFENAKNLQQQKINELTTALNEKTQKINELNNRVDQLIEEKNQQNQKNSKLNDNINFIQEQYKQLEVWNNMYHPVMEKIYACMALKAFVEENKLGNSLNLETTLQFVKCIGNDYRFAHRIYNAFAVYKREIQEPLTQAELAVYKVINEYYRNVKHLTFDIFSMPNGFAIGEDMSHNKSFDKDEVKDLRDPCNVKFRSIQCVYVPILRTQDGKVALQGIVKGLEN